MRATRIAVLIIALAVSVGVQRADAAQPLRAAHQCRPLDAHLRPPVAGYLILDTAHPEAGLFYARSEDLTSGLFVGWGGTWRLRYQCRK